MITDESLSEVFIEAILHGEPCADWMSKAEYWGRLGVPD